MARSEKQKLKILYVLKLFMENTDDMHAITANEIIEKLKLYGIEAERKSIYNDIASLNEFGFEIENINVGNKSGYHILSRPFELPELKLLIDTVQASKFISEKKTNELIKKLEGFASRYEAGQLQRQVYVHGRVKASNEQTYYNVDKIHVAINGNKQISFKYYEWTLDRELKERKNGELYVISPWALTWNNDNYYLIGYEGITERIKHYRVDKMKNISVLEQIREGRSEFEDFDIASFTKETFSMFGGENQTVKLRCANNMIGVIIDRFGQDIIAIKNGANYFTVNVDVTVSSQFFAWVFGLQGAVKIVAPEIVVNQMKEAVNNIAVQYSEEQQFENGQFC